MFSGIESGINDKIIMKCSSQNSVIYPKAKYPVIKKNFINVYFIPNWFAIE